MRAPRFLASVSGPFFISPGFQLLAHDQLGVC